jgi:hypothetical protein
MRAAVVVETAGDAGVEGAETVGTLALAGVRSEEGVAGTCGIKFRSGEISVGLAGVPGGVSACRRS